MSSDFKAQRLFVEAPLEPGASVEPTPPQTHYLLNVLRLGSGESIRLFNGRDGEWRAAVERVGRRACVLRVVERLRPQPAAGDLHYLFAPLKAARLDYMAQKAVEMGASKLVPVLTRHTQVTRLSTERLFANAVEAAEQCGILSVPEIAPPSRLDSVLAEWEASRRLVFCDEALAGAPGPIEVLRKIGPGPLAVLIGPEGGFSDDERGMLSALSFVTALPLGPRVLRADTAAVAALALVQATLGDWR